MPINITILKAVADLVDLVPSHRFAIDDAHMGYFTAHEGNGFHLGSRASNEDKPEINVDEIQNDPKHLRDLMSDASTASDAIGWALLDKNINPNNYGIEQLSTESLGIPINTPVWNYLFGSHWRFAMSVMAAPSTILAQREAKSEAVRRLRHVYDAVVHGLDSHVLDDICRDAYSSLNENAFSEGTGDQDNSVGFTDLNVELVRAFEVRSSQLFEDSGFREWLKRGVGRGVATWLPHREDVDVHGFVDVFMTADGPHGGSEASTMPKDIWGAITNAIGSEALEAGPAIIRLRPNS